MWCDKYIIIYYLHALSLFHSNVFPLFTPSVDTESTKRRDVATSANICIIVVLILLARPVNVSIDTQGWWGGVCGGGDRLQSALL